MGLFDKIRGEFVDIIEWLDNTSDTIAYRFERHQNEIKQGAKLTVRPGQIAVFVSEGQVADVFDPGMHELYTRNLPVLGTLKGWPYGFNSPFKAEVYFFNTKIFTNLRWGTSNPVIIRDPELGPVRMRAFGTYNIKVSHPEQLLKQLISTDGLFQVDEISEQLRNTIVSAFANWVGSSRVPLLDFAANYTHMGEQVRVAIQPSIQQFGLELTQILIENISMPPEVEEALDKRASIGLLGNMQQYTQYQAANALEASANNPSGGNQGLELGMGMAVGQQMTNMMQSPASQTPPPPPPPIQTQWYIAQNGQQSGPFELHQLLQNGLTHQVMVWRAGFDGWKLASQVPELASLLATVPPPPPPAAA
ncbi:SPFH domain-containing protein [Microcoleus vaginatus GB2-A3]|uniref:SPFH domain-containing protein n=1 Tax=Microcoleus vaginatus TaxID=119532 RepID=UPI0032A3C77E